MSGADTDTDIDIDNDSLPPPAPPPQATTTTLKVAPILSTTDDPTSFNFTAPTPALPVPTKPTTDSSLREFFEIDKTVKELKAGEWARIALQFPDELLGLGAARVCEIIQREVNSLGDEEQTEKEKTEIHKKKQIQKKVFILADTSYGSCCVDEIAAQHISADVLVHYGRACLSPTTRLPVIYIFTNSPLSHSSVISGFAETFPKDENKDKKIILMADVMYTSHLSILAEKLKTEYGYTGIWEAKVVHNPGALLPNRTLPAECVVGENDGEEEKQEKARRLREEWGVFHVGTPMASLLLVLASRVGSIHVYPTPPTTESGSTSTDKIQTTTPLQTMPLLRRRYALLTHLRSASIIGILVSTLTVKNYLSLISLLQRLINSKGKKSYMVVVGKVNPEKLANFSEIEGWVGVGCWEQGVVGGALERGDGGRGFWRGVVTPWELGVALGGMGEQDDDEDDDEEEGGQRKGKRWEWNGEWITDFDTLLAMDPTSGDAGLRQEHKAEELPSTNGKNTRASKDDENLYNPLSHIPESAPPDFDLRTGRYSSYSSSFSAPPTQSSPRNPQLLSQSSSHTSASSSALTHSPNNSNQIVVKGGVFSPAAEFLREKRTWKGLVVGYEEEEADGAGGDDGAQMEVGRSGVARGYTVGDEVAERDRR